MSSLSIGAGSAYTSYAMMSARGVQQGGASEGPSPMAQALSSLEGDEDEGTPATSEHSKAIPASAEEPSAEIDVEGLLEMMGQGGDDSSGEDEFGHRLQPSQEDDQSLASLPDGDGNGAIDGDVSSVWFVSYGDRLSALMSQLDTDGFGTVSMQSLQTSQSVPSDVAQSGQRADPFVQFALGQYQSIAGLDVTTTSLLDIAA
jgi:hypothetical protein